MGKFTSFYALALSLGLGITSSFAQNTKVDLGELSDNNGNFRYVAIGSSLSAGVRDGGVYAAAQQTSFPALLAQQMGIKDFKQPLLEGNGTGKRTFAKDRYGNLKFAEIKGLDDKTPNAQLPKVEGEMDNLAVPYQKLMNASVNLKEPGAFREEHSKVSYAHSKRFETDSDGKSYLQIINEKLKKIDFFTFELGMDDCLEYYKNGAFAHELSFLIYGRESYYPEIWLLEDLKSKGAKGVIFNLPDVSRFPLFQKVKIQDLNERQSPIFVERFGGNDLRQALSEDLIIPSERIFNAIEKQDQFEKTNPIRDHEVIGIEEYVSVDKYNSFLKEVAERYAMPLFDLNALYKQVLNNENENIHAEQFFSEDGITPSEQGNIVITNELIILLNNYYKSNIPLIP
jgi:lysophospholipase L1-like esterase